MADETPEETPEETLGVPPGETGTPRAVPDASGDEPLLAVRDLTLDIATPHGTARILQDVSLDVRRGEIVGVVGESGSGKSMTALSVLLSLIHI